MNKSSQSDYTINNNDKSIEDMSDFNPEKGKKKNESIAVTALKQAHFVTQPTFYDILVLKIVT